MKRESEKFMSKNKCPRKGSTLIEMLVTLLIFFLIAGILFMMMIKSKVVLQSSAARSSSRQDLQVVSFKIAQDLMYSKVGFVTDGSAGGLNAFSFISAQDSANKFILSTDGTPAWQKQVIYYIPAGTTNLMRKEMYVDFKANPAALAPLTLAQLSAQLNGTGKLLSGSVTSLKLTPNAAGQSSADLSIQTQAQNQQGKPDQQSGQVTIYIVN